MAREITCDSWITLGEAEAEADVEVVVHASLSRADAWEGGGTVVEIERVTTDDGRDVEWEALSPHERKRLEQSAIDAVQAEADVAVDDWRDARRDEWRW